MRQQPDSLAPDRFAPDDLAHQLRAAVLGSDHPAAQRLVVEYVEALREYWAALGPVERAASTIPQQSLELLNWVHDITLMQRGLLGQQRRIVEKSKRYQTARTQYLQTARLEPRPA
jgi:hypothetical protein